ncbi:MAG: UDP-glucose/GDP-mannose dehydrogenase family protein, partial [Deltaproteobacteria bacterium]|nr:UDP-glucose/GDP-mannose dehydrogenase family protein [Deltaproteobacteria bacterium]
ICIVGVGYVGLVTGTCFAEFGNHVICVDKDEQKIDSLKQNNIPIYEPGLEEMVKRNQSAGRLNFTQDVNEAVEKSLAVFIAVGTPSDSAGSANLEFVYQVAETIGKLMTGYKIIVTKSTVPVGTGKEIREIIRKNQEEDIPFDVVSNPEFLREGSAIEDFLRPNRVVIGTDNEQAAAIMKDIYSPLYRIEIPFLNTNVETAEMIKYASNAFLATKISFINEMANICELVGADVHEVARGMGLDGRISRKFLHPGPGYGGSCFPKDTKAIVKLAETYGYRFKIVESVIEVNERQQMLMVDKIENALGDLKGKRLGIWGLTFKPNTDDIRDSPAMRIIETLIKKGAIVSAYDPAGMEPAAKILKEVNYVKDIYEAAKDADALVIITEWNEFRYPDWEKVQASLRLPTVIDMRNIYEPEKMKTRGFNYHCVGRGHE